MEWFRDHKIKTLPGPSKRPIENLWGKMARKTYGHGKQYRNKTELVGAMLRAWSEITMDTLHTLVAAMKN